MSNFFIIGNGFDLAHGFNTSYNNFKEWMCNNYDTLDYNLDSIPKYVTNYRRLEGYDEKQMAQFFYHLISGIIGEDWRKFESALSHLDWISVIKDTISWHGDDC